MDEQEQLKEPNWGAAYLGVKYERFLDMHRDGILPSGVVVRLGRRLRVNPTKLREWVAAGGSALPGGWRRQPANV